MRLRTIGGTLLPIGMTTQIVKKNGESVMELIPLTTDTRKRVDTTLQSDTDQRRLEEMYVKGKSGVVKHIRPDSIRYIQKK